MDETPIKTGRAGKGKLKTIRYWPFYGEDDEICFTRSNNRGKDHVTQQLGEFAGTLLTDGYPAYDAYGRSRPELTKAQCWAHTRRYYERSLDIDPSAQEVLKRIGVLYGVEMQIRDQRLEGQAKLTYRVRHAHPAVEAFFARVHAQRQRIDLANSDPLAKALVYAENLRAQLQVYVGDPVMLIATNHLERALRVVPMGRKKWLFNWTGVGARHVGAVRGLLTICRLQGVVPHTYLVDVLQRISLLPPARDDEQLTPRRWKVLFAANPQR